LLGIKHLIGPGMTPTPLAHVFLNRHACLMKVLVSAREVAVQQQRLMQHRGCEGERSPLSMEEGGNSCSAVAAKKSAPR
jgi:hypothetical protein